MRYRFIEKQQKAWPITLMCGVLGVSRSGYYDWTARNLRQGIRSNIALDRRIREIFTEHRQRYGAPRITGALHDEGMTCSENRVARRMCAWDWKRFRPRNLKSPLTRPMQALWRPICSNRISLRRRPIRNGPVT